jgi:glycosyltransferase involved in cell wall biosynthesis
MRILSVADVPRDPHSGVAGTEYQTIRALRALGHEVDDIWQDSLFRRIRHGNLHYAVELPRALRSAIRGRLKNNSYDVVHVNQPHAFLAARDHQASGRKGVFVNRSHGWELRSSEALKPWRKVYGVPEWRFPRGLPGRMLRLLIVRHCRSVCRDSDGIIVYCTECRDFITSRHGVPPGRVAVVPAAAPDEFLEADCPSMQPERAAGVLYASQFAFFKAPMLVADTVNRVMRDHRHCTFTWVCNGKDHQAARSLLDPETSERTVFLDWHDQSRLMQVYDQHGIFLFPSFFEGFGKVFIEAMSRGLCVVASDTSGAHDVIEHGRTGMLAPVGDSLAMADIVSELLAAPDRVETLGRAARAGSLAYTWKRAASETIAFYEHLLALKETGRGILQTGAPR